MTTSASTAAFHKKTAEIQENSSQPISAISICSLRGESPLPFRIANSGANTPTF
jgi:hypothetical protein